MRLLAAWVLAGSWAACTTAEFCEWHLDYFVYHRVNYTGEPWSFSINPSCTKLQLNTYIWRSIDDAGAAALALALASVPRLEELGVAYNNIGDNGAVALAGALKGTPELRQLYLGWNGIGDKGAEALAGALQHTPKLEELNLFWNNLGEAGTAALASALNHTPHLRKLSLAWNSVGNAGASALAEGLRHTPRLSELSVAWSGIGNRGAISLAASLGHLPQLQELRLRWNDFGDTGAEALAHAITALEKTRTGERVPQVFVSGIPWPILDGARNGSSAAAASAAEAAAAGGRAVPSKGSASQVVPAQMVTQECAPVREQDPEAQGVSCAVDGCSALVVGNANYTRGALPAAALDNARGMAEALERIGFTVSKLLDGSRKQMRHAVEDFARGVKAGAVALVYFNGLGLQLDGANYLLPVDYSDKKGKKAVDKAVGLSWLLQLLGKRQPAATMLVADACRPIPFALAKTASEGLVPMMAPPRTLVALAALPGTACHPAADSEAQTLYTKHLLSQLEEPGLSMEEVFRRVRRRVAKGTAEKQVPWEASSLLVDLFTDRGVTIGPSTEPAAEEPEAEL